MEREIAAALDELRAGWVEFEAQGADFGDQRLNKRYAKVLGLMSRLPQSPFNQSAECLSEMVAAYRFVDNGKVTPKKLLAPHHHQIAERADGAETVLLVQDTTFLDMSDHSTCTDLHPLKIAQMQKALWLHTTLGILPNGLPLGILDAQFMSGKIPNVPERRGHRPIEEMRSRRWLDAIDNCQNILGEDVRKVWICDREADIYELFDKIQSAGDDFIIRCRWQRPVEERPFFSLRQAVENSAIQLNFELTVHPGFKQTARVAKLAMKYLPMTVSVPDHRRNQVASRSVPAYVVDVAEVDPPEGVEPLHWRLLTTLEVRSANDALQIIDWYKKRWAIEELFKILKSGCRAEKAQFQSTERLSKYITMSLIVAWRIYYLVHVNRLDPDAPAQSVLTPPELETLQLLLDDKRQKKRQRRIIIKTAKQAITQIAKLGGYLDRKNDPHPGIVVLWKGTMALAFSTMTLLATKRVGNS